MNHYCCSNLNKSLLFNINFHLPFLICLIYFFAEEIYSDYNSDRCSTFKLHTSFSSPGSFSGFSWYCLDAGHLFNIRSAGSSESNSPFSLNFWIRFSAITSSIARFHEIPLFCFWLTWKIYLFIWVCKLSQCKLSFFSSLTDAYSFNWAVGAYSPTVPVNANFKVFQVSSHTFHVYPANNNNTFNHG